MSEIYSSPEKYGLRTIGEVEWSDGCYQFDLTVIWQDTTTGVVYYADDSGCSCPSPFEDTGRDDLTVIDRPQTLIVHLAKRQEGCGFSTEWDQDEIARTTAAIGALVQKTREAGR